MATAAKNGKKVVRKRREKKNVEKGQVHIRSSFNNTMVTVTDMGGNALSWACLVYTSQWARSGGGVRVGFEGGQMPLTRRLPKRGFHNIFAERLEAVNVSALNKFEDGATVNACDLLEKGILSKCEHGVKILGNGTLTKKLTVRASAFSASAKEKIVAAGGKYEVI